MPIRILPANKKQHPLDEEQRKLASKKIRKGKEIKVSNKQADLTKHKKAVDPSQRRQQRKEQQKQALRQYQKQNLTKDYAYTGIPGAKATAKGVRYKRYNIGGRANLLEEMGRIDARRHPDAADRAEKRRVIGELNKGYKSGGRSGYNSGGAVLKGKKVGCQIK